MCIKQDSYLARYGRGGLDSSGTGGPFSVTLFEIYTGKPGIGKKESGRRMQSQTAPILLDSSFSRLPAILRNGGYRGMEIVQLRPRG